MNKIEKKTIMVLTNWTHSKPRKQYWTVMDPEPRFFDTRRELLSFAKKHNLRLINATGDILNG